MRRLPFFLQDVNRGDIPRLNRVQQRIRQNGWRLSKYLHFVKIIFKAAFELAFRLKELLMISQLIFVGYLKPKHVYESLFALNS